MVSYYNFLTAYEDLLRNGETPNSNVIDLTGWAATSTNGTAGRCGRLLNQYPEPT